MEIGDHFFIKQHQATFKEGHLRELTIAHKYNLALSLMESAEQADNRNAEMVAAYQSGTYTMAEIASYFDVHYMTVNRAVRAA